MFGAFAPAIESGPGGTAHLTVTGGTEIEGNFDITASSFDAALTVENGSVASIDTMSSDGTAVARVVVDDAQLLGSSSVELGEIGIAELIVKNAGLVDVTRIYMGILGGAGSLNVSGGGYVDTTWLYIGDHAGSSGAVEITGEHSTISGTFIRVGEYGEGILALSDGATIDGSVDVGNRFGSSGLILVSGSGNTITGSQDLGAFGDGDAILLMINGELTTLSTSVGETSSILMSDSTLDSPLGVFCEGSICIADGICQFTGLLELEPDSLMMVESQEPCVVEGQFIQNGDLQISSDAKLVLFDYLANNMVCGTGDLVVNGIFDVGDNEILSLETETSLKLKPTSTLVLDINGSTPGSDFDRIRVEGDLELESGHLELVIDHEFVDGEQFKLIAVDGNSIGTFTGLPEGAVAASVEGTDLTISYIGGDGNDVVLTAVDASILYGDVNLDGAIDLLDIAPFVQLISSGGYQPEADINTDGVVDLLDVQPFVDLLAS